MAPMPSDAWPLDPPMLPPLVLRPPHGPRLVRLLVMILAGMFHLGTAGWSVVTNGPEGAMASSVKNLILIFNGRFSVWTTLPPGWVGQEGPLQIWLTQFSFTVFGFNEFALRLPAALGAMAVIWFTMRLAERFGGIWRGLVAALILICTPGMFTLGRVATALPLAAAFIAAAFYFLEHAWTAHPRSARRRWLLLVWLGWSGTVLAGGWTAGGVIALGIGLLALFYRAARLRFRALLSWEGGTVLALTLGVMWAAGYPPGAPLARLSPGWFRPPGQVYLWQAGLLFPWSLLLLPALGTIVAQLAKRRPLEWSAAFPLAWLASGLALTAASPSFFFPIVWWPAFAVWAAVELATLHRRTFLRWTGLVVTVALGGVYLISHLRPLLLAIFPNKAAALTATPDYLWYAASPIAFIALIAFVLFTGAAFCAEWTHSRRFALLAYFAAMIPAGFAFADLGARFAPYFSDAGIARHILAQPGTEEPPVIRIEDMDPYEASSLLFYLRAHQCPEWKPPFFLVIPRDRLAHWKETLPGSVRVESTESEHLLLSVKP